MKSMIKDPALAGEGQIKIAWAKQHMPVLNLLAAEAKTTRPLAGKNVNICLHIEAKTACLALTLQEMGANVSISACNPLSTQDEVAAALADSGIAVFGIHGADAALYEECIRASLFQIPDLLIDDGGDLVTMLHQEMPDTLLSIIGGCEETTTGVQRLRRMADRGLLKFPMIAVNDADCKHLFDNRYGTGQSVWAAICHTTNLLVAGQTAVIAGYGWCGRGLALRAHALGAKVIVTEIDPVKGLEALMDGYDVMPMRDAAPLGDFFISATGNRDILTKEDFAVMKDGAVLANAGHFDVEISKTDLRKMAGVPKRVRENIEEYTFDDGRKVFLLGEGRLANLACGQGHPAEIMDMSFAVQLEALLYLLAEGRNLKAAVHLVPQEVDKKVATAKLKAMGKGVDRLTEIQENYYYNS